MRPPTVPAGSKLTKAEIRKTKLIAGLRVHVVVVIRRFREFFLLKTYLVTNLNLIGMLALSITTACAFIKIQDALIK